MTPADRQPTTATDRTPPHVLLSGGGSGGHVFPGLAVAEELARRGWQVSWAGSSRGLEARLVGDRRIPFFDVPARPLVGRAMAGKLAALVTLARSAWRARGLVKRLDARVVLGTGGYVSAPAVIGARLASRPALLFEPNGEPGFANRLLSRFASEAAVAFEAAAETLSCPARTTGVPVRPEFFEVSGKLPAGGRRRILILGGSQGARELNELVPRAVGRLPSELAGDLAVVHQAGKGHAESTRAAYDEALVENAGVELEVTPFLDDVAGAMAASHLLISRAGAITLAEICAVGRPSLLAPLCLAGAHQATNARRLTEAGAAEIVPLDDPSRPAGETLAEVLTGLLGNRERLAAMAAAARGLGRSDAASAIADRVESLGEVS